MKYFVIFAGLLFSLMSFSCEKILLDPNEPEIPSPSQNNSKLAVILDSLRYKYNLPALAGAIITDNGVIDAQAVGCRRYGGPANITVNDRFHLGSNTKAFTSVLIGILIDEGYLSWTTTLSTIFPEYSEIMRAEYREVNVRDLLSHTAGFRRDANLPLKTLTPMEQRAEVVAWALMQPPVRPRGSNTYSNLSNIIAGAIAEKLTKRPFEELLSERVLKPLGITTAGFGAMGTAGLEDQPLQHTVHYAPIEPGPESDNHPIYSPAGCLHMSVGDWARYIQWVLACESGNITLLKPETAKMLTAPLAKSEYGDYYALGWAILNRNWANGRTITHGGCNGWNYSIAWLAPNRHFGVIAMTNIAAGSTIYNMENEISERLINFYLKGK